MFDFEQLKAFRHVFAETGGGIDSSQFEFLNLDDLAARYGERWPQVRERIFETCEQFISKRIGKHDLLVRAANGFVVLPHPSRKESAADFTRRIELELKEFFLGSDYLKALEMQAETLSFSLKGLMEASQSRRIEEAAEAYAASTPPEPAAPRGPPDFDLVYEPVWSAKSSYIAMCCACPTRRESRRPARVYHQVLAGEKTYDDILRLDLDVLERTGRQAELQKTCLVTVPVHFLTLTRPRLRMLYVAALSKFPAELKSLLGIRILAAPADAPAGSYAEAAHGVRAHCRRVFLDIDFSQARLDRLDSGAIDGLVVPAPCGMNRFYRELDAFTRFTAGAGRRNMAVAMTDCAHRDMFTQSRALGVSLFAGPLFPEPEPEIWKPRRYDPETRRYL